MKLTFGPRNLIGKYKKRKKKTMTIKSVRRTSLFKIGYDVKTSLLKFVCAPSTTDEFP